jgi:hypothetical protein
MFAFAPRNSHFERIKGYRYSSNNLESYHRKKSNQGKHFIGQNTMDDFKVGVNTGV